MIGGEREEPSGVLRPASRIVDPSLESGRASKKRDEERGGETEERRASKNRSSASDMKSPIKWGFSSRAEEGLAKHPTHNVHFMTSHDYDGWKGEW